jgi:hypothetical protein
MPKRSSKRGAKPPADENRAAFLAVRRLTGHDEDEAPKKKNPAAVALGRLGGKVGGPARAAKLSKKRKVAIAKKAAAARWKKDA